MTPDFFSRHSLTAVAALVAALVVLGATGTSAAASPATPAQRTNLVATKTYLLGHTVKLRGFTTRFQRQANDYFALAKASGFDYSALWASKRSAIKPILARSKSLWIEGNPYYERVEGVVAGTPSLAVYDVILDAGSSAKEDPASAVPFDLELADGRVLRKPGNLFNLTEGMLWGTRPEYTARGVKADLDGDGKVEFGEALPDAAGVQGVGGRVRALRRQARPLREGLEADCVGRVHRSRRDGADDERVLRTVEGFPFRAR